MSDTEPDDVAPTTFSPLRNPVFRPIWLATQAGSLGWMMHTVAIGWIMATLSTSDVMVALVQASAHLPVFLLSIFAGAMADSFGRRRVLLAGQVLITLSAAVLTATLAFGLADPWTILGLSFLLGCGFAINDPAWSASVGDIVGKRELPAAVTLLNIGFNTVRSIGPAIGGLVIALFSPLIALALSTLCYAVPLGTVWHHKWAVRPSTLPRERILPAIHDGVRFTAISPEIKATITRGALFGIAGIAVLALLPLVVRDQLQGGPFAYGVLMAGFGIGALIGGLNAARLRRMMSQERLIRLACLVCGASVFLLAFAPSVAVAALVLALGGAGWVTAWSGFSISVQLASPRWIVGRTIAIYYALVDGGLAAGSWLWGGVAETQSLSIALIGSAGALVLVAATGFLLPVLDNRDVDHDPLEGFEAPEVAVDLKPRSGPILVRFEYRIAASSTKSFLSLMQERRNAQRRLGARHWIVERDLYEPELWTESFRTPTWTDYLRFNHRRSAVDLDLDARLQELHAGDEVPQSRLSIERPAGHPRKPDHITPFAPRI